ncbi:MAG: hypothetical protein ACE5G2_00225 [Candidatus Krumholzibacteriia bacterium]
MIATAMFEDTKTTTGRHRIVLMTGLLVGLLVLQAGLPVAAEAASGSVQYVSATNIYLDVGKTSGLTQQAVVWVVRSGQRVAKLQVEFVAQHSAACRVDAGSVEIQVGDVVEFSPAVVSDAPGGAADRRDAGVRGPQPQVTSAGNSWNRLWSRFGQVRGRVVTYYTQSSDAGGTYRNPSLFADVRFTGHDQEDLTVRVRADRPAFSADDGSAGGGSTASDLRMFEARMRYRTAGAAFELEGGRLLPRRLENMGTIDGASVSWRARQGVRVGAAVGQGAELGVRGFAGHGKKFGGYVELDWRRNERSWHALLSGAQLLDPDVTRRQFLILRSSATLSRDVRTFQSLEVDVNPGWKRSLGEPRVGLTAWSLGSQFRVRPDVTLLFGLDSRRSVLLPELRDAVESLELGRHYGVYGSTRVQLSREQSLRLGGDLRRRPGGVGWTRSWDATLHRSRIHFDGLSGRVYANGYGGDAGGGWFLGGSLLLRAGSRAHFDVSGGAGRTHRESGFAETTEFVNRSQWLRVAVNLLAVRGLWLDISNEWRNSGQGNELTVELGRVF